MTNFPFCMLINCYHKIIEQMNSAGGSEVRGENTSDSAGKIIMGYKVCSLIDGSTGSFLLT